MSRKTRKTKSGRKRTKIVMLPLEHMSGSSAIQSECEAKILPLIDGFQQGSTAVDPNWPPPAA